jgi:hypothetical protein
MKNSALLIFMVSGIRVQADWTFILQSELPTKELHHLHRKMPLQASQYVVPRGSIILSKWRSTFSGSSDSKMNVQSTCALNTLCNSTHISFHSVHEMVPYIK